jgi:cytochrome d ubiquinol oxidase subunit II
VTDVAALSKGPLFGLPLPELWFGLVFFLLGMFLFLDGFDFGVGALFATREDHHEREQLLAAIGPFWDGNEVWLVVFGGALFAAFPSVYAGLFSRNYLLMFVILGALILRGLAPEMYEQRESERWQRWWGRSFVVGSVAAPFSLGVFTANWLLGSEALVSLPGVVVGLTLVALTVLDGVAFLRLKTRGSLRDDLSSDGVRAAVAYLVLVVVALGYLYASRPTLRAALLSPAVLALVVLTVVLTAGYVVATRRDHYYLAFGSAAGLVFALVAVVATLLYPSVDPATGATVRAAIVSTLPLNLMSVAAALLLPLVLSYFVILYSSFSGPISVEESY